MGRQSLNNTLKSSTARQESGTTKAAPARARAIRKQGLTISEVATALGVKQATVYNYLCPAR
jgi:predicted transcriptional regulator